MEWAVADVALSHPGEADNFADGPSAFAAHAC